MTEKTFLDCYTGEPWLAELGLLHLRARWYDPNTGTFLSRDALEMKPPYQYVKGNPINATDPSGYIEWFLCSGVAGYGSAVDDGSVEVCGAEEGDTLNSIALEIIQTAGTNWEILEAIDLIKRLNFTIDTQSPLPFGQQIGIPSSLTDLMKQNASNQIIKDRGVTGYLEGWSATGTSVYCEVATYGEEVVYDFVTGERSQFSFAPANPNVTGVSSAKIDATVTAYAGFIWGFKGKRPNLVRQYAGPTVSGAFGGSIPLPIGALAALGISVGPGGGATVSSSASPNYIPNLDVRGITLYSSVGGGVGGSVGGSLTFVNYSQIEGTYDTYLSPDKLVNDIENGTHTPPWTGTGTAINYVTGYRSKAAHVARLSSPGGWPSSTK